MSMQVSMHAAFDQRIDADYAARRHTDEGSPYVRLRLSDGRGSSDLPEVSVNIYVDDLEFLDHLIDTVSAARDELVCLRAEDGTPELSMVSGF